jgi:hypothetical protein
MLPLVLILAGIAGFLWWRSRHPYVVTREQMKSALEDTLQNKMGADAWHRLVHTPIPRDRYLDSLRQRLAELPLKASTSDDGALYEPAVMASLAALLDDLRKKRA